MRADTGADEATALGRLAIEILTEWSAYRMKPAVHHGTQGGNKCATDKQTLRLGFVVGVKGPMTRHQAWCD